MRPTYRRHLRRPPPRRTSTDLIHVPSLRPLVLTTDSRLEAAKNFDPADDLEFCPVLTPDQIRQYNEILVKAQYYLQHPGQYPSPPTQTASPSPSQGSPPQISIARDGRPPSRTRGTAAIKIIDPVTREERRRQFA
jgi:hypothetical protein